jgi:hypothetical protein
MSVSEDLLSQCSMPASFSDNISIPVTFEYALTFKLMRKPAKSSNMLTKWKYQSNNSSVLSMVNSVKATSVKQSMKLFTCHTTAIVPSLHKKIQKTQSTLPANLFSVLQQTSNTVNHKKVAVG